MIGKYEGSMQEGYVTDVQVCKCAQNTEEKGVEDLVVRLVHEDSGS